MPHRSLVLLLTGALLACSADPVATTACKVDTDCAALPCQEAPRCVAGACVAGAPVQCDASNDTACSANRCDPASGSCAVGPRREGQPCEDGEPCTWGDACAGGSCKAGETDVCACRTTADCADDGNLCNGTPLCDTGVFPHRCVVNPATVVSCGPGKPPCAPLACDPKTGQCKTAEATKGTTCDDGDPCTGGDACEGGSCVGGVDVCACSSDADCKDEDDDACTGVPYCDTTGAIGVCKVNPATVVSCSNKLDTVCRKNQCDPATGACGLVAQAEKLPCDDGDACTTGETCAAGKCTGGKDTCSCTKDADCDAQDDGNACNGTLYCDKSAGVCQVNPASVKTCPTAKDTACAKNVCDPKTGACKVLPRAQVALLGCVQAATGTACVWEPAKSSAAGPFACEDGDACTVGDFCDGMVCKAGTQACACQSDKDCLKEDDGDLCNGVPFCNVATGKCFPNPNSVVYCDPSGDKPCAAAACQPNTGACALKPTPGVACDDGEVCTTADTCTGQGACAGKAASCDDGDACTVDTCAAGKGCVHTKKTCDDGNACTVDACDPKSGQCAVAAPAKVGTPCNADSDGCTVGDSCDGKGGCVAGDPLACAASKDPCTPRVCKSTGASSAVCALTSQQDGSPCDDGDACTLSDTCAGGVCKAGSGSALWTQTSTFVDATLGGVATREDGDVVAAVRRAKLGRWQVVWRKADGSPRFPVTTIMPDKGTSLGFVIAVVDVGDQGVAIIGRVATGSTKGSGFVVMNTAGKVGSWVHIGGGSGTSARVSAARLHPSGNLVLGETRYSGSDAVGYRVRMMSPSGAAVWSTDVSAFLPHEIDHLAFTSQGGVVFSATSKQWNSQTSKTHYPFVVGHIAATGKKVWDGSLNAPHDPEQSMPFVFDDERFVFYSRDASRSPRWNPFGLFDNAPAQNRRHLGGTFEPETAVQLGQRVLALGTDKGKPALAELDRFGNQQWVRQLNLPSDAWATHMAVDEARGRVIIGGTVAKSVVSTDLRKRARGSTFVASVSLWGRSSCGARGKCAGKALGGCDDDKPCTADDCSATAGCTHTTAGVQVCSPASGCSAFGSCFGQVCKEQADGRQAIVVGSNSGAGKRGYVSGGGGALGEGLYGWWFSSGQLSRQTVLEDASLTFRTTLKPVSMSALDDLAVRPDGVVLALGRTSSSVRLWRFAAGGTSAIGTTVPPCNNCTITPAGLAVHTDGSAVVAVNAKLKSFKLPRAAFFDPSGKLTTTRTLSGAFQGNVNGVAVGPYGDAVFAGRRSGSGVSAVPLLTGMNSAGKTTFISPSVGTKGVELYDVDAGDGQVLIGAGVVHDKSGGTAGALVAVSALGKQLWTVIPSSSDGSRYLSVLSAPGGAVVGGEITSGSSVSLVLRRLTSEGATLWSRSNSGGLGGLSATRGALGWLPDGRLMMAGRSATSGAVFVRASVDGWMSCNKAPACNTKDCDDGKPCTADWCASSGGCQHAPLSGPACGAGGTCSKGVCGEG